MKETLYRPHAADGTHYCENKDLDGWIKGSTLDDESNKVHGTLDLEPVDVDLDGDSSNVAIALGSAAVVSVLFIAWNNRDKIAAWVNASIILPLKKRLAKLKGVELEDQESTDDVVPNNIVSINDYLELVESQDSEQIKSVSN